VLTHRRPKLIIFTVAGIAAAMVPAAVLADELLTPQTKSVAKTATKAPSSAAKVLPERRLALADRRARFNNNFWSGQWMADLVARVIDPSPATQRQPRLVRRAAVATPAVPKLAAVTTEPTPVQERVPTVVTAPIEVRPTAPPAAVLRIVPVPTITIHPTPGDLVVTKASPITTGTVISPAPLPPQTTSDTSQMLMSHAERTQASHDLIKLELANRTYAENLKSGQSAFEKRQDWRVLERARDAMTSAELSAAESAGFESNAYINEAEKTIVVAIAGTQDLRRDFLTADIWQALIKSEAPQQFFMAKSYIRSVMMRYQARGFTTECVGHSLGGGACAYAAAELGIRALVVNPIAAGRMPAGAKHLVRNYVVDGDIAQLVYAARGNEFIGDIKIINDGQHEARTRAVEKYGPLAGPILVIRDLRQSLKNHMLGYALDRIAEHAGVERQR
jgi:hypothetical protein